MTMPAQDAWSYSGDPTSSDKDQVRFYLQDVDVNVRLLSDSELSFLIGTWKDTYNGSLIYVAAVAAEIISFKFAGITTVAGDGVTVDLANLSPAYAALAKNLRDLYEQEQIGGEVDLDNLLWSYRPDPSVAPLRFGVGVMDNPEAGEQDYGGVHPYWWTWGSGWVR